MIAGPDNHLPGPFDLDVKRALDKIVYTTGIDRVVESRKISFSIYSIVDILGLKMGGTTYKNIKSSLERLHITRYVSENAFFLKGAKRYVPDSFFLIERLNFNEVIDDTSTRTNVVVYFGSYYIESLKAYYVKPLDLNFYLKLKKPIPKRLYGILDKRSYRSKTIVYDLVELAKVIPLSSHTPSKVKQVITPALEDLTENEYISSYRFYSENKVQKVELKIKKGSAKKQQSELSDVDEFLVDHIIHELGDQNYPRSYYENMCKTVDHNFIYRALSEVKEESTFGEIKKSRGALFTTKIKRYLDEVSYLS
ncbi:MAG: replication initiator protein A [bacterium]